MDKIDQDIQAFEDDLDRLKIPKDIQDAVVFKREDYDFLHAYIESRDEKIAASKVGWTMQKLNKKLSQDKIKAYIIRLQKQFNDKLELNNINAASTLIRVQKKLEDSFDEGANCGPALVKATELMLRESGSKQEKSGQQVNIQLNIGDQGASLNIPDAT